MDPNHRYSTEEAAKFLDLCLAGLRQVERAGELVSVRVGPAKRRKAYLHRDLIDYLERCRRIELPDGSKVHPDELTDEHRQALAAHAQG